jgi:hypothetical protein
MGDAGEKHKVHCRRYVPPGDDCTCWCDCAMGPHVPAGVALSNRLCAQCGKEGRPDDGRTTLLTRDPDELQRIVHDLRGEWAKVADQRDAANRALSLASATIRELEARLAAPIATVTTTTSALTGPVDLGGPPPPSTPLTCKPWCGLAVPPHEHFEPAFIAEAGGYRRRYCSTACRDSREPRTSPSADAPSPTHLQSTDKETP